MERAEVAFAEFGDVSNDADAFPAASVSGRGGGAVVGGHVGAEGGGAFASPYCQGRAEGGGSDVEVREVLRPVGSRGPNGTPDRDDLYIRQYCLTQIFRQRFGVTVASTKILAPSCPTRANLNLSPTRRMASKNIFSSFALLENAA